MNTEAAEALGALAPEMNIWEAQAFTNEHDGEPVGWVQTFEGLSNFRIDDYFYGRFGQVRYVRAKALMAYRQKTAQSRQPGDPSSDS